LNVYFQYEPNEHRNKTLNQTTPHNTTNNTMPHSDDEITKSHKRKHFMRENQLFKSKKRWE